MTEARYVLLWAGAFAFTCLIELPIVFFALRNRGVPAARVVAAAFFGQLATHPWVWFAFPGLPLASHTSLALSELFAWWIEAALYALVVPKIGWRAIVVSLAANLASYGVGALIWR